MYQGALVAFQRDTRQVQSPELLGQAKIKVMLETSYITSIKVKLSIEIWAAVMPYFRKVLREIFRLLYYFILKVNRRGTAESYERKDDHQELFT